MFAAQVAAARPCGAPFMLRAPAAELLGPKVSRASRPALYAAVESAPAAQLREALAEVKDLSRTRVIQA